MKIPASGADCSRALCGTEADIISPENLWEVKQKQGCSDNFQHHYDEPRGYHVPVHDEGDGETCPLPGRLGWFAGGDLPRGLMRVRWAETPSPENMLLLLR